MSSPMAAHLSADRYPETGIRVARVCVAVEAATVHATARRKGPHVDDQAQGTLSDEDIRTILPVGGVATKLETDPDADDADGTDGDATDGTDGDSSDADGTDAGDGSDADGTDGKDADGTDGVSSATS